MLAGADMYYIPVVVSDAALSCHQEAADRSTNRKSDAESFVRGIKAGSMKYPVDYISTAIHSYL